MHVLALSFMGQLWPLGGAMARVSADRIRYETQFCGRALQAHSVFFVRLIRIRAGRR